MNDSNDSTGALLLRGARIVLPQRRLARADLLIEAGRIARISEQGEESKNRVEKSFDLGGLTLFPGFIDVHIHGAVGVDTMEATTSDLGRVACFLAENGVTGWLPTLVPAPLEDYRRAVSAVQGLIDEQEVGSEASRALGIHYEGPFLNSAQCGALRPAFFKTFSGVTVLEGLPVLEENSGVHMITVAPEIDGGTELVAELVRRGWIVSIGHTRADIHTLDMAHQAGARHMTHFMNAMSPFHHRLPGPIGWGLLREDVSCDLIADGVHLHPLTLKLILRSKTADRLNLISDSVSPAGLGDGEYRIWGETITVDQGRTRNAHGSIAGSVITMRDAVQLMLSLDVPLEDVARMAATNPARLIGVDHECGSIEEGKRADLVALDGDGNVRLTIVGGKIAFEKGQNRLR